MGQSLVETKTKSPGSESENSSGVTVAGLFKVECVSNNVRMESSECRLDELDEKNRKTRAKNV